MIGLLRMTIFVMIFWAVFAGEDLTLAIIWDDIKMNPMFVAITDFSIPQPLSQILLNPLFTEWYIHRFHVWKSSSLEDHWLFQWATDINGAQLFARGTLVFFCVICLYLTGLVFIILYNGVQVFFSWICCKRLHARHMPEQDSDKQRAVRALLEKAKSEFAEVHEKIKPIVALTWPWRGGGLWQHVALLLLDVALDINTVFTFLLSRQFVFAALTTFLVARSGLKQLSVLTPWHLRQADISSYATNFVAVNSICFASSWKTR